MNKYQEALDYVNKSVCTALSCLGVNDTKTKESLHTLQELVDKEKSPTIEEVKKEWEKLGYEFSFKNENNLLDIVNLEELSVIKIDIKGRKYIKVNCVNYSGFVPLTYEEHILLTKIFIALGWL